MNNSLLRPVLFSLFICCLFPATLYAGELPAQLAWSKRLILSTTVTGVVDKILVSPGQRVNKGDTLLSLDDREFKAARDQAAANQLAAKTTYDEAKRELARSKELFDRTMISEHDLQLVRNAEAQARAGYLDARARLQAADIALERSRVQAPYDGIVLNIQAQQGQTVLSNLRPEPLATIAEAGHMIARAWLPSSEVDKYLAVKVQAVRVASEKFTVVSQQLMPEANEKGQYAFDVLFSLSGSRLQAGQAATIVLP